MAVGTGLEFFGFKDFLPGPRVAYPALEYACMRPRICSTKALTFGITYWCTDLRDSAFSSRVTTQMRGVSGCPLDNTPWTLENQLPNRLPSGATSKKRAMAVWTLLKLRCQRPTAGKKRGTEVLGRCITAKVLGKNRKCRMLLARQHCTSARRTKSGITPTGHSAIQAQRLQAPRQANQYQYQTHQGNPVDTNGNQRTIDDGGRQGRGDGLWDHPAMIEAGFATPERVRGGHNRQRVSTEEREVDEEQGDRAEPGFLDMLGPRIKSLFRCGSRKQSQRVPRQMSAGLHTQRVDEERHGARMTARGIVPPPDSFRNAYQPQLGDRTEHGVLQTPAASDAGSRAREGRLPSSSTNQDASPMSDVRAAMSRSETIHISGGIFIDISIHI
ncbi:hypothetical protein BKA70DRAFT_1417281 [Coprinopsis sp. MPI-PUGE-AT-0042]|nr:hypothetical protein BKA70DRAFT_1417281 [Coprinopsis sp. MPI-PUGE-AT-0042]